MAMKRLTNFRFAQIHRGDTLQRIAQRELGDATRWVELIAINDLAPPYLTGDPLAAGAKVKLYGDSLIVPAVGARAPSTTDAERVFLADVALVGGQLRAGEDGDLGIVAGRDNLKQAYRNRIDTPLGDLIFHPAYGCGVHSMKGQAGRAGTAVLAAQYVRTALLADPRTQSVLSAKADLAGDAVEVTATAQPITGSAMDIGTTV